MSVWPTYLYLHVFNSFNGSVPSEGDQTLETYLRRRTSVHDILVMFSLN